MKFFIPLISFSIMLFFSCQGSYEPIGDQINSNIPYGIWVYAGKVEDLRIYCSANKFESDKPGIAFENENVFIERTSGWCGTPPITYFNLKGSWDEVDENNLKITCPNCMESQRIMKIIYLSDTELKVFFLSIRK